MVQFGRHRYGNVILSRRPSTALLRNKMELFGPFRPGETGEGSQVVYGLGLYPHPPPSPRHVVTRGRPGAPYPALKGRATFVRRSAAGSAQVLGAQHPGRLLRMTILVKSSLKPEQETGRLLRNGFALVAERATLHLSSRLIGQISPICFFRDAVKRNGVQFPVLVNIGM